MKRTADLVKAAQMARLSARAAYSGFRVGAAVETRKGRIFGGCNVESATYGLTVCAERVAIWKALSEGETVFRRIAVVTDGESLTPPCGACRQIIWEYCGDIEVLLANLHGKKIRYRIRELLPLPFDKRLLPADHGSRERTAIRPRRDQSK